MWRAWTGQVSALAETQRIFQSSATSLTNKSSRHSCSQSALSPAANQGKWSKFQTDTLPTARQWALLIAAVTKRTIGLSGWADDACSFAVCKIPVLTLAKSSIAAMTVTGCFAATSENFFAYPAIDPASLRNHFPCILFAHAASACRDCPQRSPLPTAQVGRPHQR